MKLTNYYLQKVDPNIWPIVYLDKHIIMVDREEIGKVSNWKKEKNSPPPKKEDSFIFTLPFQHWTFIFFVKETEEDSSEIETHQVEIKVMKLLRALKTDPRYRVQDPDKAVYFHFTLNKHITTPPIFAYVSKFETAFISRNWLLWSFLLMFNTFWILD